jgi:hypothetical protein
MHAAVSKVAATYTIPRSFNWRGKQYQVKQIGGHWRIRGRWWEAEGDRHFFRVITTNGVILDLCVDQTTGQYRVAAAHD